MKLYVWDGVLTDYSSGIMVALAHSVAEARDMLCPPQGDYLGWTAQEALYKSPGHLNQPGLQHSDLRDEPQVFDPADGVPVCFTCWGGG